MMLILHSILCGPFATRYAVSRFASLKKMQSFIGMADRCTVTFGRFSFADIPIWVEPAQREQLEQLTGES